MKRKYVLFLIIGMLVLVTGCGKDKKTVTCKLDTRDDISGYNFTTEHTIKVVDGIVDEITTVETMEYDDEYYNENTVNDAKASFVDFYAAQNDVYGGYDNKVEIDDKKIISTTILDFSKINTEKFLNDNIVLKEYEKDDKGIAFEGFVELYKSLGATCDNE